MSTPNWHAAPDQLARYVAGALGRTQAASVEAHLVNCPSCRAALGPLADPPRLQRNLDAIAARVAQPRRHAVERLLERVGVPEHLARTLGVTPSQRGAWLTAIIAALLIAGAAALVTGSDRTQFAFLVAAPLLPLVGVTSAITLHGDPMRELLVAAPTPAFTLFVIRAVAVLAPTIAAAVGAAVLVPRLGWEPVLWLLPAFGLAATTLALGSWLPIRAVAWTLGATWTAAALIAARGAGSADPIERFAAFRPAGQLVLLGLSLLAVVVVTFRRDSFDLVDIGRIS